MQNPDIEMKVHDARDYADEACAVFNIQIMDGQVEVTATYDAGDQKRQVPLATLTASDTNPLFDVIDELEEAVVPPDELDAQGGAGYVDRVLDGQRDPIVSFPQRIFERLVRARGLTPDASGKVAYLDVIIWPGMER